MRVEPGFYKKLLALKILRHKTMTDAVHEALEHYFAEVLPETTRASPTPRRSVSVKEDEPVETVG